MIHRAIIMDNKLSPNIANYLSFNISYKLKQL